MTKAILKDLKTTELVVDDFNVRKENGILMTMTKQN